MPPTTTAWMRISELSRRVGVSAATLRAWEGRYGLLAPRRNSGNMRLYSAIDEARVRLMVRHIHDGVRTAQAAELALSAPFAIRSGTGAQINTDELRQANLAIRLGLDRFDETAAHLAFQRVMGSHSVTTVIGELVIPYMRDVGERWADNHMTVAQEHFTSNFFAARLQALARGWDHGLGPRALLACAPGDQHTLGLLAFGIGLHRLGWRITYLGADTPVAMLASAAKQIDPDLVGVAISNSGTTPSRELREQISAHWPLIIAGPGANPQQASRAHARYVESDPITAALPSTSNPNPAGRAATTPDEKPTQHTADHPERGPRPATRFSGKQSSGRRSR